MPVYDALKRGFLRRCLEIGVVQFGQFKLKAHHDHPDWDDLPLSPFYVNFRRLRGNAETRRMGAQLFGMMCQPLPHNLYADIPTSITPVVTTLSDITGVPFVTSRGDKGYGSGDAVDGIFEQGMQVVVFDDLRTTSASKKEAITTLRGAGLVVEHLCIFLERGKPEDKLPGCELHYAYDLAEVMAACCDLGEIKAIQRDECLGYPARLAEAIARHQTPA